MTDIFPIVPIGSILVLSPVYKPNDDNQLSTDPGQEQLALNP